MSVDPQFADSVPKYVAIRYALGEVVTRSWQLTGDIVRQVAALVPGAGHEQVLRQLKRGTNLYERGNPAGGEYTWRKRA